MTRRQWLQLLALIGFGGVTGRAAPARGMGRESLLDIGRIRYASEAWNTRPNAIARLLTELEVTTSIAITTQPSTVDLTVESLFTCPMVVLTGDRAFAPWSDEERDALSLYLQAGGFLLVDSSEGRVDGEFRAAVERELSAALPGSPLERVPSDHVIRRTFYLVDGAPGRVAITEVIEGVSLDERLAVVFVHNDLLGALERDGFGNWLLDVSPGGEPQRTMAHRLAVNLAMYATCLDYKDDQVHVPFLLDRRRWRVE